MTLPPQLTDALIAVDGRIATLTLNRDDVRNELTGTGLVDDIVRTAEWINSDESISVLILTGAGQAFSAGGNVKHMLQREGTFGGTVYAVQQQPRRDPARRTRAAQAPSMAAVNGAAIGAGFDLACLCDLRIAATGARMGETFVNLGIIPGDGGAWLLQQVVGYQRAAELSFSGRIFDADEARQFGLGAQFGGNGAGIARCLAGRIAGVARPIVGKNRLPACQFLHHAPTPPCRRRIRTATQWWGVAISLTQVSSVRSRRPRRSLPEAAGAVAQPARCATARRGRFSDQ
jgi:enoyl-CoA hydratase/carnithine racemase